MVLVSGCSLEKLGGVDVVLNVVFMFVVILVG